MIELHELDLTSSDTQTVFVVAWIDEEGGDFQYVFDYASANTITREQLNAPEGAELYTFMVTMPFGDDFGQRIADTYYEHINDHLRAVRLAQQMDNEVKTGDLK
jgi:hypothetical protein